MDRGGSCKSPIAKRRNEGVAGNQVRSRSGVGEMEDILEVLLNDSDAKFMDAAVEHILERQTTEEEKLEFLQRSLALGLQLQDVASRLTREHSARHNSFVWPFTHDLSIKIFSGLGTHSLCHAAAACTMFNKLAMEAACYANVDLTPGGSTVTDETVAKIIQRAGRSLRTLKLGVVLHHCRLQGLKPSSSPLKFSVVAVEKAIMRRPVAHDWTACPLSKACLHPLAVDMAGSMLRSLHLFNIEEMDSKFLYKALVACPALVDLKIVGLNVSLRTLLECLGSHCHNLESLCCQQSKLSLWPGRGGGANVKISACHTLVKGCPKVSSLTLSEYRLADRKASVLVTGLVHLTHLDFSGADYLNGLFLREMIAQPELRLKTLILRDCIRLKEAEVNYLLFALRTGECKSLRHLDISNRNGLAAVEFGRRVVPSVESITALRSERPSLYLLADYPNSKCGTESDSMSMDYSTESENMQLGGSLDSSEYLSENSYTSSQQEEDEDEEDEEEEHGFMSLDELFEAEFSGTPSDDGLGVISFT